jgi:hypothetical protein
VKVNNIERFREQVRSYRALTGKTQEDLAKVLGLNPQVLSHRLHGVKKRPVVHHIVPQIKTRATSISNTASVVAFPPQRT